MNAPGRVCPLRYCYGPAAIARAHESPAETLYVIGGLYGNLPALDSIETMVHAEPNRVTLCFNGDFNWFNIDDAGFRAINERVLRNDAILGNVEAELGSGSDAAGCGCAYPDQVDEGTVERSNQIHAALKRTAARHPDLLAKLDALPTVARYRVGEVRIGVVHGDAESLAGWRFDVTALDDPAQQNWRADAFIRAGVDVFASTHTCLPAARRFDHGKTKVVANNGAAGMPNISNTKFGILTRIATTASPHPQLYGHKLQGTHIDALAINYDDASWQERFLENWPKGSPAWLSYFNRMANGPDYRL
ncbi:MAG: hypothetical protein EPO27_11565 [Betaproteobacteria bacterium]|nr:MAG: hypothetical protein EPO27_11565 [Betaproteobacteria bacterium]